MKYKKIIFVIIGLIVILTSLSMIKIKKYKIEGNNEQWSSAKELESLLFPNDLSKSAMILFVRDILNLKTRLPFVENYSLVWNNYDDVTIKIKNRRLLGYVEYMNTNMYFGKDGVVTESTTKVLEGIPKVNGLKLGLVSLDKKIQTSQPYAFERVLEVVNDLALYEINVDSLDYKLIGTKAIGDSYEESSKEEETSKASEGESSSSEEEVETQTIKAKETKKQETKKNENKKNDVIIHDNLVLHIGNVSVECGKTANIDGKLQELKGIMGQIVGLEGVLHLEKFGEVGGNSVYTFDKKR